MTVAFFIAVAWLAWANGANDNFKGVATLFGSNAATYRRALGWGTLMTLLGSIAALVFGGALIRAFSGKGLVGADALADPSYLLAVCVGAAATVLLATLRGFPISTTHAIIGALIGAGIFVPGGVDVGQLGTVFILPLMLTPLAAMALTGIAWALYRLLKGDRADLDTLHALSAGATSFARGLQDTAKIVGLLVGAALVGSVGSTSLGFAIVAVGVCMALGGLLSARRVAFTLGRDITPMTHGQGLTANLVTSGLVVGTAFAGMPASTTHCSVAALFAIGATNRGARWGTIGQIVLAWIVTLPVAALLATGAYLVLR